MRDFILIRKKDITGRSGTGVVAEGTIFQDGQVVLKWLGEPYALGIFTSIEELLSVHGHEGNTYVQFMDKQLAIETEH
ncbi:hypothetical protein LARV_00918 [Longilinea arvoryzae]|uniref:Uncharacterized protein n=1 Tax=Longilinea arvoryzae TaxID=360412 RepID=A0A0S7B781_9CHLR|nr:hypothetical protein [Longilinea arvoryzae]GAP13167.1 hypothetical protein LARV_00918 [Longilinea arvoryzae]